VVHRCFNGGPGGVRLRAHDHRWDDVILDKTSLQEECSETDCYRIGVGIALQEIEYSPHTGHRVNRCH